MRGLWVACALSVLAPFALPAAAQTCHAPRLAERDEQPFYTALGLQFASYDAKGQYGSYQGLYADLSYRQRWFGAELFLPAYRLTRIEGTELGLGDLVLTARGTALSLRDGAIALGAELPVMLPTGSADRQLGMGHVMLMPAAWFELALAPVSLRAQFGYGRALGSASSHAHHHHGVEPGRSPLVNPMNREELTHALAVALGVQRHLSLHARWFGALVLGEGVSREVLGGGVTLRFEYAELLVEMQKPVLGDPFDVKLVVQAAARF